MISICVHKGHYGVLLVGVIQFIRALRVVGLLVWGKLTFAFSGINPKGFMLRFRV